MIIYNIIFYIILACDYTIFYIILSVKIGIQNFVVFSLSVTVYNGVKAFAAILLLMFFQKML